MAIAVLFAACSGNSGPGEPGAMLDEFGANFVHAAVADADDGGLTDDEARCVSLAILESFGQSRLVDIGISPDGASGSFLEAVEILTGPERRTVVDAFETCLSDPLAWLFPVFTNDDQCILDYIRDTDITLEQLLFAEIPEFGEEVGDALVGAYGACSS